MSKGNVTEFCDYLVTQVGQPYVWGGQHLKLTPETYEAVITRKESDAVNRLTAINYCKARFDMGATVLYAYDCSGLGMYWLQNVKKILPKDLNANAMMQLCELVDKPQNGFWVFRMNGDKASHIGYMVSDTDVVHAKGRAYGVCRERYSSSYWHRTGKPSCMDFEEPDPPEPDPPVPPEPPTPTYKYIRVKRKCRIRKENNPKSKTLLIARVGMEFPMLGQADKDPYWYFVTHGDIKGYITSNEHYTEEVNKL